MSVLHRPFLVRHFLFLFCILQVRVLQSSRREVQSLAKTKEGVSMSYFAFRNSFDLKCVLFRRKYDFSVIWNTPFITPCAKSLFTLKISLASFYNFLWWMVKELPLTRRYLNDHKKSFYDYLMQFQECKLVFHSIRSIGWYELLLSLKKSNSGWSI